MKRLLFLLFLIILPLYSASSTIMKLKINGAIGPSESSYIKDAIVCAQSHNVQLILLELNTPGGLSTSMREMTQDILNSPIPVATYVYPKGSRAASAGTYLLYASHIAAMAQGTNLGAATSVSIMPGHKISTLKKEMINDSVAYMKSLTQLNDRNISWAIDTVRDSKSLSAEDALNANVIDFMAYNTRELLSKLHGKSVKVLGENMILNTNEALIINYEANFKTRFLSIVTNPNMTYIFLLIAIYGIFFELMNPGFIFPGIIGGISGVIALYALNIIPFNYAGLALIALGIFFMIAELFVSGFGVLGIGGVISFALGSVLLFDAQILGDSISISLILAFTAMSMSFFILVIRLFIHSRRLKVVSGAEELVGAVGEVIDVYEDYYHVHCHGEVWQAESDYELSVSQKVEITKLSGLTLEVKPLKE